MLELQARLERGSLALDVALSVPPGACLALAGPSGAGKSTVLRVAAGLLRPDAGVVVCGGETWLDTARGIDLPPERRRCGFVFQDHALFPHLSAWRNVVYGLGREGSRAGRRARALELLDRFGLRERADARPSELSGGERQRVAVARALARRPALLLLDEPLSALDARTRAAAARELGQVLHEAGVPAVLVTHDFFEAALLGDRVGVLERGRLVQEGTAEDVAGRPASAFVADFAGAVVLLGSAHRARDVTLVRLDGGGTVASTDDAEGRVAATVFPWDIVLEPEGAAPHGSAQNRVPAQVASVTSVGGRARIGLSGPQPLVAEVTEAAVRQLALAPGRPVVATWKAAATRVVPV